MKSAQGIEADVEVGFCGRESVFAEGIEQAGVKSLQALADLEQIAAAILRFFESGVETGAHTFLGGAQNVFRHNGRLRNFLRGTGLACVGDLCAGAYNKMKDGNSVFV